MLLAAKAPLLEGSYTLCYCAGGDSGRQGGVFGASPFR